MLMRISFRYFAYWLALGALTAIILVACNTVNNTHVANNRPQAENCRVVKHRMGETCIPLNPQRVINLAPDNLANCWALGIRPIASPHPVNFPLPKYLQGKIDQVESVGGYVDPNLEKILRLKPDLIISGSELTGIYKLLSHIAPTVVIRTDTASWIDIFDELATVLDKEEVGKQLLNQYWRRVETLKAALGARRKMMEVSVANTSSEYGIWAYGEGHFSGSVLKDIGLQRPKSQRVNLGYINNISQEKLSDIDGDVLFFVSWEREDDRKTLEKLKQNPLWSQLEVVQKNKVYVVGTHWHNSDIYAIDAILDDLEKYLVNTL